MALTLQEIKIGDNFRAWRLRFNELLQKTNSTLQDNRNLDDLLDKGTARTNLDVYSKSESTTKFLDTTSSLKEIADAGKEADARSNLDVYSKTEGDSRYFEESKLLSEVSTANQRTLANNINMYLKGDVYTKTESNIRYMQISEGNITAATANSYLTDFSRDGVYNVANSSIATGASKYGTLVQASAKSSSDASRLQFFAPDASDTTDALTGTSTTESGLLVKTGRESTSQSWTRLLSVQMGEDKFFDKSKLFSELSGVSQATARRSATDNLDVYQKADVYSKTQADTNYYKKSDLYTKTEAKARFLVEDSNLSDLSNKTTARSNLGVYSTTESNAKYLTIGGNLSDLDDAAESRTNLNVYSKSDVFTQSQANARFYTKTQSDANYYGKSDLYTRTEADGRYLNESSNLSDLPSKATSRTNLDVYSKGEANIKFTEHLSAHNAGGNVGYGRNGTIAEISSGADQFAMVSNSSNAGMHVNYSAAKTGYHTPDIWYWHNGTGTSYAGFEVGNTRAHGTLRSTGKLTVDSASATLAGNQIATQVWSSGQYYTKATSDSRYFSRVNKSDLFAEIKGANITDTQRTTMLDNLGVYTKAEIDANFQTGATSYLSQSSNLSDLANKAVARNNLGLGSASTSVLSTSNGSTSLGIYGNDPQVARQDHEHFAIRYNDTRTINQTPTGYLSQGKRQFNDFKTSSVIGISGGETYSYLVTQAGWSSASGGYAKQTAYNNDRIYHRRGTGATTWSAWKTVAFLDDKVADSTLHDGKTLAHVLDWNNTTNKPSIASADHNHDTRYLGLTAKASDSNKLDGIDSTLFMRKNTNNVVTAGSTTFNDNIIFRLGTGGDVEHFWNGTNYYTDVNNGGDWLIRDGNTTNTTRFTFDIDNGIFKTTGVIYEAGTALSYKYLGKSANASSATKLKTARTISLTGDATGTFSFDGTANKSFDVTVANDSHTHDGRYYTETESNAKFFAKSGGTISGTLDVTGKATTSGLRLRRNAVAKDGDDVVDMVVDDQGLIITMDNDNDGDAGTFRLNKRVANANVNLLTISNSGMVWQGQNVFRDNYHPNADKLTTARTLSLTGDATGSMVFDGSVNKSMTVTVANDSHTHDGRYYTETESNAKFLPKAGGNISGLTVDGKLSMTGNGITVVNYTQNYAVNNTTPKEILDPSGSSLLSDSVYELQIGCRNTGTPVNLQAYLWNYAGKWYVSNHMGVNRGSNNCWITIDDNVPMLHSAQPTFYSYDVVGKKIQSLVGDTKAKANLFGINALTSSEGSTVYLNDSVTGEQDRERIYTSGYHPEADNAAKLGGYTKSSGNTPNTIISRDGSGDIKVRLIRSEYQNQSNISGAMAFRTNNSSDNYVRFCSDKSAIRTWLDNYSKAETDAKYIAKTGGTMSDTLAITKASGNAFRIGSALNDSSDIDFRLGNGTYDWIFNYQGSTDGDGGNEFQLKSSKTGAGFQIDHDGNWDFISKTGTLSKIWHSGNDGSGSGLDADKLDGREANQFAWLSTAGTYDQILPTQGSYLRIPKSGLLPESNGVSSLGTSTWRFSSVYANSFFGALSGNASTATKLKTARTLSLTGDATGSLSFDGSANKSMTVTVANDSHTHDGRYFTETESNAKFIAKSTDISMGTKLLKFGTNGTTISEGPITHSLVGGTNNALTINGPLNAHVNVNINGNDSNDSFNILSTTGASTSAREVSKRSFWVHGNTGNTHAGGKMYANNTQRVFADDYHPNADKLTTARKIELTGEASGSAMFDGSGNVTIDVAVEQTGPIADISGMKYNPYNTSIAKNNKGQIIVWGTQHNSTSYATFGCGLMDTMIEGYRVVPLPNLEWKQYGIYGHVGFALATTGEFYTWGGTSTAAIGIVGNSNIPVKVNVGSVDEFVVSEFSSNSINDHHCVLFMTDGSYKYFGTNNQKQAQNGVTTDVVTPITWGFPIANRANLKKLYSFGTNSQWFIALETNGNAWFLGDNGHGQAGDNTTTDVTTWKRYGIAGTLSGMRNIESFIGGSGTNNWVIARTTSGDLYFTGKDTYGQGMLGNDVNVTIAKLIVEGICNKVVCSGGGSPTIYMQAEDSWFAWGHSGQGQGGETVAKILAPTPINPNNSNDPDQNFWKHDVFANTHGHTNSEAFNVFWTFLGELFTLGSNKYGSGGVGSTAYNETGNVLKVPVPFNADDVKDIVSCGYANGTHTLILLNNGELWGAGYSGRYNLSGTETNNIARYETTNNIVSIFTRIF